MITANPLHPPLLQPQDSLKIWGNMKGASLSLALSRLILKSSQPILIITPDSTSSNRLLYELAFFFNETPQPIYEFSDWETLPYDQFSPHQDIISRRLTALSKIPHLTQGAIITTISTLMQKIAPENYLNAHLFLLKAGDLFNIENVRLRLERAGYRFVSQVREHGEFAVRGAIVDLFPMGSTLPFRIDLFDNIIDSIRTFSPETQRTIEKVDNIELLPAKEFPLTEEGIEFFRQQFRSEFSGNPLNCSLYQDITEGICPPGIEYYLPLFFEKTASLFDYLPKNTFILLIENIHQKSEEFWQEINTRYQQHKHDILRPILPPQKLFIQTAEIFNQLKEFKQIKIQENPLDPHPTHINFSTRVPPQLNIEHKAAQPLHALAAFLKEYKGRILFCAETTGRREVLLPLFHSIQLFPKSFSSFDEFLKDSAPTGIIAAALDEGFIIEEPTIALITEAQLFGKRIFQRRRRKESSQEMDAVIKNLTELQIGAPIVHIDHGVGRYLGLQTLSLGEVTSEFLALEYADEDKLYVPVASLDLISRYTGMDIEHAPLHKLGTGNWQRIKRKAAEKIRDVAAELLELYAKRAAHPGLACQVLDGQYEAFAAAFPFEETPDQLRAIHEVIADMVSDKPMDRLVCGDVGFGKTEVAMRAAFMAVQNNKQVAVLVPTTLLAQQHFQTFSDRFADWPIRIALMSRFKTQTEIKKACVELTEGKIDIVIGTHKLLQQDIKFKSLGLVVIDEEHRFGVHQKERLKSLRSSVDILALTATPIPRTLNMAFSGIRDLSIIATPPARRLAIKTFVHEYQTATIQEAILREIMRGGQVYFLHNEVASIERTTREIEKLVPEARVHFAHGQMHERELEQVMSEFYHRRYNVLVATTIIESGIDIPSANTIIINRADKFGLAQLHQLRGRVGRSHHQAYAYLLIPSRKNLSADAEKRLDAIASYEDLGVGFTLATHDLEIRGAGELLGEGQSGNMQEIGFSLYMDLLSRAVLALKSGHEPELEIKTPHGIEIDLQISALIPDVYLPDVQLRLQYYQKLATAKTLTDLDDIQVEMIDRFGLLPDPAKSLLAIAELRLEAAKFGIIKIDATAKGGRIEFVEKPPIDPIKIIRLIQKQPDRFKLDGNNRFRFTLEAHSPKDRAQKIKEILAALHA
jgi:transcription-repair coupling factor (superfamily II helicase)